MTMKEKDTYTSYKLLNDDVEKYKKQNDVNFTLKHTKKLEQCWINGECRNLVEEGFEKDLVYYQATYHCSNAKKCKCEARITIGTVDKKHLGIKKIIDEHNESCIAAKVVDKIDPINDNSDDDFHHILERIKRKLMDSRGQDRKDKIKDCNNLLDRWEKNVHSNPPSTTKKPDYVSDENKEDSAISLEKPSEASLNREITIDSPHKQTEELYESSSDEQVSTSMKAIDSPHKETDELYESSSDEQVSTSTKSIDSPHKETDELYESSSNEQVSTSTKSIDSHKETEELYESSSNEQVSSTSIKILKFEELSDDNKVKKMLKWLAVPDSLLENVLAKKCMLRNTKFSNLSNSFRDKFVIECVQTLLVRYLDDVSFQMLTQKIDAMNGQKDWICICKKIIRTRSIQCDSCKLWYHYRCAGISIAPKGDWFCPKCVSSAT